MGAQRALEETLMKRLPSGMPYSPQSYNHSNQLITQERVEHREQPTPSVWFLRLTHMFYHFFISQ
jgi:hypothetical protein